MVDANFVPTRSRTSQLYTRSTPRRFRISMQCMNCMMRVVSCFFGGKSIFLHPLPNNTHTPIPFSSFTFLPFFLRLTISSCLYSARVRLASSLTIAPRNKHIQVDFGTGNNNKINFPIADKQDLIDVLEVAYKAASKGKGLAVSPKDYSTKWMY